MNTKFESKGVRFDVQVTSLSLREREKLADGIGPDAGVWTQPQKRKYGLADGSRRRWRNRHGSGTLLGFLDDEAIVHKAHNRRGQERPGHYRRPRAVEFTDRAEFR